MLDKKEIKQIQNIFTKITWIYTNFYIFKNGYILNLNIDTPYLIQLNDETIGIFKKFFGDFNIIHIIDLKSFKKKLTDIFKDETIEPTNIINAKTALNLTELEDVSDTEEKTILAKLNGYLYDINSCNEWDNFKLSDNELENNDLIESIFVKNNYIEFQPKNKKHPSLIFTKSLLPLVTEKNYTDVVYSTMEIYENLYLIIFDFDFSLFRIFMFHNYIPL